jgi:hypothetical protein
MSNYPNSTLHSDAALSHGTNGSGQRHQRPFRPSIAAEAVKVESLLPPASGSSSYSGGKGGGVVSVSGQHQQSTFADASLLLGFKSISMPTSNLAVFQFTQEQVNDGLVVFKHTG